MAAEKMIFVFLKCTVSFISTSICLTFESYVSHSNSPKYRLCFTVEEVELLSYVAFYRSNNTICLNIYQPTDVYADTACSNEQN